jgi:hypothetical protein
VPPVSWQNYERKLTTSSILPSYGLTNPYCEPQFFTGIKITNAGQYHDIKIGNRSFENVTQFRYLGTTITNQNLIQEEIKRRLNSGNACTI